MLGLTTGLCFKQILHISYDWAPTWPIDKVNATFDWVRLDSADSQTSVQNKVPGQLNYFRCVLKL